MSRVIRWLTDAPLADSILGDLEEQRRRRAKRSPVLARLWFWHRSVALAMFFAVAAAFKSSPASGTGRASFGRGLGTDLRYALRSLRKAPWYAVTVVGVIALGMTLATTVFAVVDGVLFRPLPYPQAGRLVTIGPAVSGIDTTPTARQAFFPGTSAFDIAAWKAAAPGVEITAFRAQPWSGMGEGINEAAMGVAVVQPNVFDVIGVRPLIGGFTAADFDHVDTLMPPVVITHELWQTRFHGRADVIGQTLITNPSRNSGWRVAGVMPRGFVFPAARTPVRFITPSVLAPKIAADPTQRSYSEVIARLPAGMSAEALRARVEAGMQGVKEVFPAQGERPKGLSDRSWRLRGPYDAAIVMPLADWLGRRERPLFRAIFLAALVLVALGGLNVSGLMAARGLDRARELSLRRALGASTAGIARLVFVEAAVPILTGALIGLALTVPLLQLGASLLPEELVLFTPQTSLAVDARVVLFVLVSAFALALPATIWPIRRATGAHTASLAEGSRGSTRTRSIGRTIVIVTQVAGALVLTLGGALLVTSLLRIYANTPAIRTDGIVALGIATTGPGTTMGYGSPERTVRMNRLLETLRRVPGVQAVALTDAQVLVGGGELSWFAEPPGAEKSKLKVGSHAVSRDFYRVLEPQLVAGRFPEESELDSDAAVAVVSESVAKTYWPGGSPLGQTLIERRERVPFTVIGVVKDVRWNQWDDEVGSIYGPYAKLSRFPFPTVFVRTDLSPAQLTAQAVQAIAAADPLMRVERAGAFEYLFRDSIRARRFQSWLFGSFAAAALVIVGAGILGLIAMSTARRTREMGIRLALGSSRDRLVRLLLREQLIGVALGIAAGSVAAFFAVRFVRAYLYQTTPYEPRVWAAAITMIILTTMAGTLIPALRASRTDPVRALRVD
jgi:predicted permease